MVDIFKDSNDTPCSVCEEYPCLSDCPAQIIENDVEDLEPIKSLFENFVPNEDILNTELSNQIGNHLLIIADAILEAQHKWEQKTYMNRVDEIINTYKFYSNFAESLYSAGMFETVEDLMEFIKNPKKFDQLYNLWLELGYPKKGNKMFYLFKEKVQTYKYL